MTDFIDTLRLTVEKYFEMGFDGQSLAELPSLPLTVLRCVVQEIHCILIEILPVVVVSHYRLRIPVARHHLHLPV